MSAVAAPFGFRPSYNPIGLDRAKRYTIAGGYPTALFKGMPVILNTNGTINAGTAGADLLGVFIGCTYVDANGKPNVQSTWPAGQAIFPGTVPEAWIADDPNDVFEVQASGSIPQTAIGDQSDVLNVGNGSLSTGLSTCALNATLAGAAGQGQFRIVGISPNVDNVAGDAFTVVQVQIARHQYIANKAAI